MNTALDHIDTLNTDQTVTDHGLSKREGEILNLIVLQYSNAEIAVKTNVTRNTVKFHLKNLLMKLEVSTRQEAARKALTHLGS